jgi:hypothetical protein
MPPIVSALLAQGIAKAECNFFDDDERCRERCLLQLGTPTENRDSNPHWSLVKTQINERIAKKRTPFRQFHEQILEV